MELNLCRLSGVSQETNTALGDAAHNLLGWQLSEVAHQTKQHWNWDQKLNRGYPCKGQSGKCQGNIRCKGQRGESVQLDHLVKKSVHSLCVTILSCNSKKAGLNLMRPSGMVIPAFNKYICVLLFQYFMCFTIEQESPDKNYIIKCLLKSTNQDHLKFKITKDCFELQWPR